MYLTLLKLVNSTDLTAETTDHKFMVSGHSFLPNDAHFGMIEAASRRREHIYIPGVWKETIMNAKRNAQNVASLKLRILISVLLQL